MAITLMVSVHVVCCDNWCIMYHGMFSFQPVNIDRFPHETGDYIQERAVAMDNLTR